MKKQYVLAVCVGTFLAYLGLALVVQHLRECKATAWTCPQQLKPTLAAPAFWKVHT